MDKRYASLMCPCMREKVEQEPCSSIALDIPGFGSLECRHLVLDYNGTVACDGELLDGVADRLKALALQLQVTVLTADTHGTVREKLADLPVTIAVLPTDKEPSGGQVLQRIPEDQAKRDHLQQLGPKHCAFVGNGRNDHLALRAAGLGIALVQAEGASPLALTAADIVVAHIHAALDLLLHPARLVATLRS